MTTPQIYKKIAKALDTAPRNAYVAELHLQSLKYAELLVDVSGKEFCENLNLKPAWGTEFTKMKKIADRLRGAGLDPELI